MPVQEPQSGKRSLANLARFSVVNFPPRETADVLQTLEYGGDETEKTWEMLSELERAGDRLGLSCSEQDETSPAGSAAYSAGCPDLAVRSPDRRVADHISTVIGTDALADRYELPMVASR
jgi:hypothetical protein